MIAILLAGAALAADLAIPYEKYELDNGLDVILAPDTSTPIVHVNVWYHVGSKDETAGLTGFAHLFEHLMFQGSPNNEGEYFTPLQEVGGSVNGTTSFDRTNYFETVPSQYLPLALFVESDRMGWLLDVLDEDKLANQQDVVRNERRQRYENPPYGEARKTMYETLWPKGHPYHHMTIGSHEDLENAKLDDVKAFFRKWYVPNNASLVVAGDFDKDTAKRLIEREFGGIAKGPDPERLAYTDPGPLADTVTVRQYDDVPHQKVWLAWRAPAFYQPGDAELDLLSSVLSDGKDSRLHRVLVQDKQIAKDVAAYQASAYHGSTYVITGTAAKGHTTDELVAAIDEILATVWTTAKPTSEELTGARNNYERRFYGSIATISGKANLLNSYNFYKGEPDFLQADLQRYLDAGADEVVAVGQKTLSQPRVELHIWPEADKPEGAQ